MPLENRFSLSKQLITELLKHINFGKQRFVWMDRVPDPVVGHKIVSTQNGEGFYLVGGWSREIEDGSGSWDAHYSRTVWKYNLYRQKWSLLYEPPTAGEAPSPMASHSLHLLNERTILMYGGSLSPLHLLGNSNTVYLFHIGESDPSKAWTVQHCEGEEPDTDCGWWFGRATCFHPPFLYSASGIRGFSIEIHRLDLRNWTWKKMTRAFGQDPLEPKCRVRHEVVHFGDSLFILGGFHIKINQDSLSLSTIPEFDLKTLDWSQRRALPDPEHGYPEPRGAFGCARIEDNVYIYGGKRSSSDHNKVHADVWKLCLNTLQWEQIETACLPGRWFHAMDSIDDDSLVTFSGCKHSDYMDTKPTSKVLHIPISVPKLKNLSLKKLVQLIDLDSLSDSELLAMGFPTDSIDKLRF